MADLHCPLCHQPLEQRNDQAHCPSCQQDFTLMSLCPECQQPLEILKACGAVDYFCQNGHGLISKKRVKFVISEQ
ncbi:TPA: zinc ribbon domain-containing protein [Salmonella enterica subsp. salamae serovar 9,46:z4,z24:z39:z42]|nr:zinc ribbon domain-containing protein [Salmonella enterica subsp. salamae serovar 9,46:z4,z24:z39:z42]